MRVVFVILSLSLLLASPAFPADKTGNASKDLSNYIAIFDLDVVGKLDKDISRPLSDGIRYEIVNSGKFKVMNRAHMDKILREQAFQMTGTVAKEKMVEAGHILGVGKIVLGSIGIVGRTYMISLSLVNIETGQTERVEEDTCRCEIDELIESTKRVADKLVAAAPVAAPMPLPIPRPAVPAVRVAAPAAPSGVVYRDPATGMEFVLVKGGCFRMGDVFDDGDREERPTHEVCIDDFYLGRYEVTQAQWKAVEGRNPSSHDENDSYPVEDMSWNDAQDFIKDLNRKANRDYRLPTEAEWEYAARDGGQREKWAGTNAESELGNYAWFDDNADGDTHPVGQKRPNRIGLYDMSGNVAEWVADWYDDEYYEDSTRNNPRGPADGDDRVYRGGSYDDGASDLRTVKRESKSNRRSDDTIGFRLALPVR